MRGAAINLTDKHGLSLSVIRAHFVATGLNRGHWRETVWRIRIVRASKPWLSSGAAQRLNGDCIHYLPSNGNIESPHPDFSHHRTLYRVPSNMPSLSLAALPSHKNLSFLFRFKVPSRIMLISPPCPCVLAPLISYGLFPQNCTLGTTNGELSPTTKALAFSSCSVSRQFIGDSGALGRRCPHSSCASERQQPPTAYSAVSSHPSMPSSLSVLQVMLTMRDLYHFSV